MTAEQIKELACDFHIENYGGHYPDIRASYDKWLSENIYHKNRLSAATPPDVEQMAKEQYKKAIWILQLCERDNQFMSDEERLHLRNAISLLKHAGQSAVQDATPGSEGARLIAQERTRQISKEGWTPEHDAEHTHGELAIAAACYALHHTDSSVHNPSVIGIRPWPWDDMWWKPADAIKNLTRAGALIAAEIDRLKNKNNG